jgi:hypothetical protein
MALYNSLLLNITCPRCGARVDIEADFRFGLRELTLYHIGDQLCWEGLGVKTPEVRPDGGNYEGEAYAVCPSCERDFWLRVTVRNDVITEAIVDTSKHPYIPDDDIQTQSPSPTIQNNWDPVAHAEMMKKRTSPPVSAFFLIDSLEAIQRCIQWLSILKPYHMPDMEDSQYFNEVHDIFESGKLVSNFDFDFQLQWQGKDYQEKLRCHYHTKGQYEIELWLPGTVANEIADTFSDGHKGFWCAFMSHALYD